MKGCLIVFSEGLMIRANCQAMWVQIKGSSAKSNVAQHFALRDSFSMNACRVEARWFVA